MSTQIAPLRLALAETRFDDCFPVVAPETVTFDKQIIDTSGDVWVWRSRPDAGTQFRLVWRRLSGPAGLTSQSIHVFRWWVARVLRTRKGNSAWRYRQAMKHFLRWRKADLIARGETLVPFDIGTLSADLLIRYHEALLVSGSPLGSMHFMELRAMLRRVVPRTGNRMQPGILETLNAVKLVGSREGHAVRTRDPRKGALTNGELYALRKAIDEGVGTEFQRTVARTCIETGLYAESLSDLRSDEIVFEDEDSLDRATGQMRTVRRWTLLRPRVKKRQSHRDTMPLSVTQPLGEALAARAAKGSRLFPELERADPNIYLINQLTRFAQKAGVVNERTGEPLKLTPRRLRYSLGTGLADDGHDAITIMHALDHSSTTPAAAYIEVSRQTISRVNTQITAVAESFIKRFRGQLGTKADTSARHLPVVPNQGPSLASDHRLSGIGGCGAGTLCNLAWPLSCYGCASFVAWEDADHDGVLVALLELRELHIQNAEPRVAGQLDDVIQAVRDVIAEKAQRAMSATAVTSEGP